MRVLALTDAARTIGADERTLRRAVALGTVRFHEESPRRRSLERQEVEYLSGHWSLLAALRAALRTEPNVRLAVVYGSAARGDDTPGSDVDLLVSLQKDAPDAAVRLAVRLESALGREVDVARLNRVARTAPLLLLQALDEGRVVVDRDHEWPLLQAHRGAVARRAKRARTARRQRAAAAVRELIES
jgi:predicted nucleotidyltransferase